MSATDERFRKGQMVRTVRSTTGWRPLTPEERQLWYDNFYADCRAGRDTPTDDGGEPRLAPNEMTEIIPDGAVCEVIRARVRAPLGWSTVSGCLLVRVPSIGQVLFIRRASVVGSW